VSRSRGDSLSLASASADSFLVFLPATLVKTALALAALRVVPARG
jgi:hypothetical protein